MSVTAKDLNFEVVHIGLNLQNEEEAKKTADLLMSLFDFEKTETPISFFSTSRIEIMKKPGHGRLGHIAIGTSDARAAVEYLKGKGFEPDESTAAYFEDGRLKLVYLKPEIAGFAFHLIQKN